MSKPVKKALVPALRFPEFRDAGEWDLKLIEDFFLVGSGKRVLQKDWTAQGVPFYRTRELVSLSKQEPFSSEIFISEELFNEISQKYGLPTKGDFLVSGVGTLGISYQVQAGDKFYFKDGNVLWFKQKKYLVSDYFKFCFQAAGIQKQILGQASISTVGTYTIQNAKKTKFWYPPVLNEQQKIADCLSSLDALITAHTQKHETLKAHKKGLMQQLFPVEGETVPVLRFPEFRDAGEWEEYSINQLVTKDVLWAPKDGNHGNIHPKSSDYIAYGIPFIMANDIRNGKINYSKCSHLSKKQADSLQKGFAKEGDVLLTHKGTVGEVAVIKGIEFPYLMLTPQVTYYRIKTKGRLLTEFLAAYFITENFQRSLLVASGGGTRAYIGITEQGKLKIIIPAQIPEQQKIADCLTSIDELITTQAQKIESLKTHKKGMMQQLFPAIDDDRMDAKTDTVLPKELSHG